MDFALSDEQRRFREEVVRFARNELNKDLVQRDADGAFSREAWRRCAAFGIQGLPVPPEYGGQGADPLTIMVGLEALGYGSRDGGLIFSMNAHMWSCEIPLVKFGTEDQKRAYLPGLCDGSLVGVQAMTEPGAGSDVSSVEATAERRGDGYVLNGSKTFITNAPIADLFVVFAVTDPSGGIGSLSAFLVDRSTPGLSVGLPFAKMGLRTSPMSEVAFSDCEIPESSVLGREGAGMAVFNASMEWERSCILASAVGAMDRQLEGAIEYARDREQSGRPIGKFQAVSHRIADMKVRLETARLLLYRLGWLMGMGKSSLLDASIVKLYVSECFLQSSVDALVVRGGYGYMTDSEVEREVRDAIGSRIYSGTSDIQRNIIAGYLGL